MERRAIQCEKHVPPAVGNQPLIIWNTLNRLRARFAKTKANIMKWGYQKELDKLCKYGETHQMTTYYSEPCPARMHDRRLGFSQRKGNINCHSQA